MKKPRVLFFVLPYVVQADVEGVKVRSFLAFPYGLLSVATYNKECMDCKIIDLNIYDHPIEAVERYVREFKPSIVGFTMMFDNSYKYLGDCLMAVKEFNPMITTILGGAAASYSCGEILGEQPGLDAVCYSEGELPFRRLLLNERKVNMFLDRDKSFVTRRNLYFNQHPEISFIDDLDKVIDIDYALIDPSIYDMQQAFSPFIDYAIPHKQFFLMTSRGCPFKCTFCSNAKIHGKKMRFASVDRIIDHVKYLVTCYGMDVLTIYDDQLLIDKARAKELFRRLAPFKLRIECPNGLSVAFIDEEMAFLMKKAGMDTVYLAIESGSERVLRDIIKKPLHLEDVAPAVKVLRDNDFFIHGFFVVGMPGETDYDRRETVRFIKYIDLDWAGFNPATPVRGSELYDQCIREWWIQPQKIREIEDKRYIIDIPGVEREKIVDQIHAMNMEVNFKNNRRMRIGDWDVAAKCFEEVIRRYPGHKEAGKRLKECRKKLEAM